jgi:hypothetical protein
MQHKNLADIKHKLSIIYEHIQLMHSELRYQAKTHTIAKKLSKAKINKILHLLPQFYLFFMLKTKKKKKKKDMLMDKEITSSPSM